MDEKGFLGPAHPENDPRITGFGITEKPEKPKYEEKPLRHARSQAELTRVRQGWLLICLNATNICLTTLILLKTFGII